MLIAAVALAAGLTPVLAGIHEVWWDITYATANPDGLHERRVVGVNGSWPPPPIQVDSTDSLLVHVSNSLDEPTTLHHHGMLLNNSAWMDGAMGLSECGIPPGGQLDYAIPVDESGQAGTFWVHGHSNGHYVDGLRAPFIIHPPNEIHSYDDEYTVVLGDWSHQDHKTLMKSFLSVDNPDGAEPVPDSPLIYYAQGASYLGGFNENAELNVEPGKTYRLRIINTSTFAMFMFWIDGHEMRLIEVDGIDIQETPIDLISISVAQRYSVLITARNDSSANWAIHANMDTDMFDEVPEALNPSKSHPFSCALTILITINYGSIEEYHEIDDISLVPFIPFDAPAATRVIELEADFDTMSDGTNRGMFNQITYTPPLVPAVFSALSLGSNATVEHAYGPLSFVLEHLDVVDIIIKNADDNQHPFHFHGHIPMIVARSDDYINSPSPLIISAHPNPMRRDTINVPAGGSATLRIIADNPGAWFMHCHIEWHLEVGLAIQLIEAPLVAQERAAGRVPKVMFDHCKAVGKPYFGNAAGHNSTEDLSGWPLGPTHQGSHPSGWNGHWLGIVSGLSWIYDHWYDILLQMIDDLSLRQGSFGSWL
uniref:Putative laccase 1 n=1 Tax=Flammulina velutipes TaxID=38945 RepID=V9XTV4_FLAVE|nr:putative laccase 1 [Flammulina velutipes]